MRVHSRQEAKIVPTRILSLSKPENPQTKCLNSEALALHCRTMQCPARCLLMLQALSYSKSFGFRMGVRSGSQQAHAGTGANVHPLLFHISRPMLFQSIAPFASGPGKDSRAKNANRDVHSALVSLRHNGRAFCKDGQGKRTEQHQGTGTLCRWDQESGRHPNRLEWLRRCQVG